MSSTNSKVVHTEFGAYRPLSVRLPQFLAEYPPSEGFGVEVEVRDSLSIRPGLIELYKMCITAGRNPREVGLPPFPSANSVFFVAKLVRDGVVLNTASTHQLVEYEKDYEIAETRARQRLVAACGFDGGMLDEDENLSPAGRGRPLDQESDDPEAGPFEGQVSEVGNARDDEMSTVTPPSPAQPDSDITPALQAQVQTRIAQLKADGRDFAAPTNKRDALKFLRSTAPQTEVG